MAAIGHCGTTLQGCHTEPGCRACVRRLAGRSVAYYKMGIMLALSHCAPSIAVWPWQLTELS